MKNIIIRFFLYNDRKIGTGDGNQNVNDLIIEAKQCPRSKSTFKVT